MDIFNQTDLKKWAKARGLIDKWWYSIDSNVSSEAVKIKDVPRHGTILVLNSAIHEQGGTDWLWYRYPGYQTPNEREASDLARQKKNSPTPKQIVALNFFRHHTTGITRSEASELLDFYFDSDFDRLAYREYVWDRRHELYNQRQLFDAHFERLTNTAFYLRQAISPKKRAAAIELAMQKSVAEENFLLFLQNEFPEFFVKESTRQRKLREAEHWQYSPW